MGAKVTLTTTDADGRVHTHWTDEAGSHRHRLCGDGTGDSESYPHEGVDGIGKGGCGQFYFWDDVFVAHFDDVSDTWTVTGPAGLVSVLREVRESWLVWETARVRVANLVGLLSDVNELFSDGVDVPAVLGAFDAATTRFKAALAAAAVANESSTWDRFYRWYVQEDVTFRWRVGVPVVPVAPAVEAG